MDSSDILHDRIFVLPQSHEDIRSLKGLTEAIHEITVLIKTLKVEGRQQDIEKKCFKNQKMQFVSKILKESYFRVNEPPNEIDDSTTLKNIPENELNKKESMVPMLAAQWSTSNNLANSRYAVSMIEYRLKISLISMFYNMLVNERMLVFINSMNIPLYIYIILLRSFSQFGKAFLKYKETEKCLKFVYQYVKVTKESIPKVYIHLFKHFLSFYHKNYEADFPDAQENRERIRICYSYIFEISKLILQKNLFLAAKCGILGLLYHKCIDGAFTERKVETITEIIINFCIEEKTRTIVFNTIDLGKTFAIFTNVDMVQSIHQKLSIVNKSKNDLGALKNAIKNIDGLRSCAIMIEMYLSNWSTLMYFLQQSKTLNNFIISLKRKSEEQLTLLNEVIFRKIMKRCINYNRKKIMKSNNIFNIESNYLILKSLIILNFFYRHEEFKQLIYSNSFIMEFKESFIEILLEYFISNEEEYKNREINKLLVNNIKNINYYKKINVDISKKRIEDQGMINNNIESYYSESLLPFEFNLQEVKGILVKIAGIVENERDKESAYNLLAQLTTKLEQGQQVEQSQLLSFYKLGLQLSREIKWLDSCLDISKYLSGILLHLRCSKSIIDISEKCRDYVRCIFEAPQDKYFQFLSINILDDIGRYFYSDNKVIEYLNGYISDNTQAYKISRILLHIDYERNTNQSIDGPEKVYSEICRRGSKALVLQIIEIIKYSCEQNDNRFLSEHLQILFTLIYHNDEDIVYSIIELLEEFVNKSKELEEYIFKIDVKKVKHWNKRVLYLFLHYENAILIKESNNPTFLNDELEKWSSDENRKKTYYSFVLRELRKFTQDSILSTDYLNLNLDPSNYRKLIFLPWNIKINEQFYPIYIEYKNLQDKLKLKIYLNLIIMKEIVIEELFIGSHNYTKYIEAKHVFEKKHEDLKIKLTLEEIKKEHITKGKEVRSFVMTREETIFFVNYEQEIYKIERININIPLTLDTYRPLSHPLNFINLLCRTKIGFEFLKKERFVDHCLDIIKNEQIAKEEYKGALICLGTLCASYFMSINEKIDIYDLVTKKFLTTKNHEIQEICFWIINILIKNHIIQGKTKTYLILMETKRCGWICLPNVAYLEKETPNFKDRMRSNVNYIRDNLPEKMDSEAYRYLCSILNDTAKEEQLSGAKVKEIMEIGRIDAKVLENIIRYVSVIDFPPTRIYLALHKLSSYMVHQKFDQDYPNSFILP